MSWMRRRTTGLVLASALATAAAMSATASDAGAQAYEPNDSYITASGPLAAGTTYSAGTETDNDEDYYYFYVPQRMQMFFSLTTTHAAYEDSAVCSEVVRQTHSGYSEIEDSSLYVDEGETQTASITLDRGKYFFVVRDGCSDAGETYTFSISPPGATSTYAPFAAACAAAHAPVLQSSAQLQTAKAALARAERKLARLRSVHAKRRAVSAQKARVRKARATVLAARGDFKSATADERGACSVPQ